MNPKFSKNKYHTHIEFPLGHGMTICLTRTNETCANQTYKASLVKLDKATGKSVTLWAPAYIKANNDADAVEQMLFETKQHFNKIQCEASEINYLITNAMEQ